MTMSVSTTIDAAPECPITLAEASGPSRLVPVIEKYETGLLMLLGFAGFSVIIGLAYNALRRYVFRDFHSLDVVFDAGGRVTLSLTAVTATSQLLWPADFLQSPTLASKVGIGGSLWYTMAVVMSVLMFPLLCIQLKTRAPGAKTFPQIAYARFGKPAHVMFCVVALFTNMVITANLILAGKTGVSALTKDVSNEFILFMLAVLFGSYCLIGGLGTTFYISYFNTALIFISSSFFILKVTYLAEPYVADVTSSESLHDAMSCIKAPDGNYENSLLTFRTKSGLIYGIVMLFMTIAIIFCDQANWQSRIAAKPKQGTIGFFIAGFLWFAIPTSISFVTSMTYKAMSYQNLTNLLTAEEIDEGYITPFVIQNLLGKEGSYILLTMLTMTLMSTGSGEVMSVSSILVYDIYKTYIKPFRPHIRPTDCILCGRSKLTNCTDMRCNCPSSSDCKSCADDIALRLSAKSLYGFTYSCTTHGKYRHYEDMIIQYKSWCMVWVVICIIPYGLLIIESGMNLNWAFMTAQVFIAPFLMPLFFTLAWSRATGNGLIAGGVTGLIAATIGLLTYGSTYEGGLGKFFVNTSEDMVILTGLVAGVLVSAVVSIVVSLCSKRDGSKECTSKGVSAAAVICRPEGQHEHNSLDVDARRHSFETTALRRINVSPDKENEDAMTNDCHNNTQSCQNESLYCSTATVDEWEKTMCIDNPLNPYRKLYQEELEGIHAGPVVTSKDMATIFKGARTMSLAMAIFSLVVFFLVVPAVALSQTVLDERQLDVWISVCQHWCLIATFFVVVIPPVEEGLQIWRQYRKNKLMAGEMNVEQMDSKKQTDL